MSNYEFKELFTSTPDTGICTVNIDLLIENWDKNFSISQWKDEFYLVKKLTKYRHSKAKISTEQANIIISKLGLTEEKNEVFSFASTWRVVDKATLRFDANQVLTEILSHQQEIIQAFRGEYVPVHKIKEVFAKYGIEEESKF